jgi:hypothetical protein
VERFRGDRKERHLKIFDAELQQQIEFGEGDELEKAPWPTRELRCKASVVDCYNLGFSQDPDPRAQHTFNLQQLTVRIAALVKDVTF